MKYGMSDIRDQSEYHGEGNDESGLDCRQYVHHHEPVDEFILLVGSEEEDWDEDLDEF